MAITEIYEHLDASLGKDTAKNLTTFIVNQIDYKFENNMKTLATKDDLTSVALAMKEDFAQFAVSMKGDFAQFAVSMKGDFTQFVVSMKDDFAKFALSMKEDSAQFAVLMKDDFSKFALSMKEHSAQFALSMKDEFANRACVRLACACRQAVHARWFQRPDTTHGLDFRPFNSEGFRLRQRYCTDLAILKRQ